MKRWIKREEGRVVTRYESKYRKTLTTPTRDRLLKESTRREILSPGPKEDEEVGLFDNLLDLETPVKVGKFAERWEGELDGVGYQGLLGGLFTGLAKHLSKLFWLDATFDLMEIQRAALREAFAIVQQLELEPVTKARILSEVRLKTFEEQVSFGYRKLATEFELALKWLRDEYELNLSNKRTRNIAEAAATLILTFDQALGQVGYQLDQLEDFLPYLLFIIDDIRRNEYGHVEEREPFPEPATAERVGSWESEQWRPPPQAKHDRFFWERFRPEDDTDKGQGHA